MGSQIKRFKVDAKWKGENKGFDFATGGFDFATAEKEVLRQFDEWGRTENPKILSVNFGRRHGVYIEEDPHLCYIEVLYTKD